MSEASIDREETRIFSRRNLIRTMIGLLILTILAVIFALLGWSVFRGSEPDLTAPRDWYLRPIGFLLDAVCGAGVAGAAATVLSAILAASYAIGTTVLEHLGLDRDC